MMTPEQFVCWLHGFTEIHNGVPTIQEWSIIKDHTASTFKKITYDHISPTSDVFQNTTLVGHYYPYPNPWTTTPNTSPEITCSTTVNTVEN